MLLQESLKRITTGHDLSLDECRAVFETIMSGNATAAQIAALLVGLRMKGETVDEICGAVMVMRDKATRITSPDPAHTVDTCGTGGDGSNTFNISTAAAFVAAGAGAVVAKHGNRSVSSICGSADVLEALGIKVTIDAAAMQRCLDEAGICFLFAPALHGAMKHAIGPRKEIGIRTIFNILGPLTNPAGAPNQLLGVFTPELTEVLAQVLLRLGSEQAFVVHGLDRLDEISLSDATRISHLHHGAVRTFQITPEELGLQRAVPGALRGGDAAENARIITSIFAGGRGPHRDVVALNAAFALCAAGRADTPAQGLSMAFASIDDGAAAHKLDQLKKLSNG